MAFTRQFCTQLYHKIDICKQIKPVHILCNVQLIMFHWFTAKRANIPPATPPFQDILTRISLSIYMVPNLPSHIYQLISSKPYLLINARQDNDNTVAMGMSTLTSGSLLSGSQLPGSQFPGLSGLTTSSQLTGLLSGGSGISSRQGSLTQNPAVDSSLQALLPTGVKIQDLLGHGKGPLMEDGSPMCISFHVKGACYTNCRWAANHSKPLSATDKTMLSNWLVDQTAKRMLRWLTVRQGGTCPHTT